MKHAKYTYYDYMKFDIAKILGHRIKTLRKQSGLTQAQLSEMIDVEEMSLSRMETGSRFPRQENINKLIEALKCEAWQLFDFRYEKTEAELKKEIRAKLAKAKLKDLKYFNKMIDAYMEAKN